MSFNGSGTFNINSTGQPVVTGTVISSSVFNALTADLATGLSTCITKDGQTTVTANIPMNSFKFTNLAAGTAAGDSVRVSQLQAGSATSLTVTGTNTYAATASPALTAYTTGNTFSFVVPNSNTSSCTLNIDSLGAKAITRDGTTALVSGDLVAGSEVLVVYDGTQFQVVNSNSKTNFTVSNNLTLSNGTTTQVQYLNGSKVMTGSANMTFDGTTLTAAGLSTGGSLTLSGGTANGVLYLSGSRVATSGSALVFDGTNLGLGVTPSAWVSGSKALQIGSYSSFAEVSNGGTELSFNSYQSATTPTYKYIASDGASRYRQVSGAHYWFTAPSGTAGNTISFTQAMTLEQRGSLALGRTSATNYGAGTTTLSIDGTSGGFADFYFNGTRQGLIAGDNGLFVLDTATNVPIIFKTVAAERARIDTSGNLLVGTTNNDPTFNRTDGVVLRASGNVLSRSSSGCDFGISSSSGTNIYFYTDNGSARVTAGSITSNSNSTAYNTSSDYRLKDNQQPLTGSGAFIDALKPKTWEWKADGSKGVGFIAHEVQEISPGTVVGEKDAVDADGKPVMQAMEYGSAEFIANIVAELQSLRARVAQLENK